MTNEEKVSELADYLRVKVHGDASSAFRQVFDTRVFEIDIVHPSHGVRVLALSVEVVADNNVKDLKRRVDNAGLAEEMCREDYQPILITNFQLKPYVRR